MSKLCLSTGLVCVLHALLQRFALDSSHGILCIALALHQ